MMLYTGIYMKICSQHCTLIFQTLNGSVIRSQWWNLEFKHIQVFMHVLVTSKNEEDPIKNEGTGVVTACLPL